MKVPNNSEVCKFLLSFYDKPLSPLQFFFCCPESSEQDLNVFIQRLMVFEIADFE